MADRKPFSVSVVTPDGPAFEGDAEMIIVPGAAGEIGVLARHAPLIATLKSGSTRVHHIHGTLGSAWCTACGERHAWTGPLAERPPCPDCGATSLRPDIVWFGEIPYGMDLVEDALAACDLFVSVGTSGLVYPAAAFVHWARGATLELNLEPSAGATDFAESRQGPATELVPAWVDQLLA